MFLEDHTFPVRKLADRSMGHELGVSDRKGAAGRSQVVADQIASFVLALTVILESSILPAGQEGTQVENEQIKCGLLDF